MEGGEVYTSASETSDTTCSLDKYSAIIVKLLAENTERANTHPCRMYGNLENLLRVSTA